MGVTHILYALDVEHYIVTYIIGTFSLNLNTSCHTLAICHAMLSILISIYCTFYLSSKINLHMILGKLRLT